MNDLTPSNLGIFSLQNALAQKAEALARDALAKDALDRQRAAQEFASLLYLEVLKTLRATLPKDGLFENQSLSRDIYSSMFDSEVARVLARRDATGFTKTVERAIDKLVSKPRAEGAGGAAPVDGVVSSSFGMRHDPIHGGNRFHGGVDIAAPMGSEVKAPIGGKVIFSGAAKGYGNMVEIDHGDNVVTRFAHNAANLVAVGDKVKAGQAIAMLGNTGQATGAHLHFEVRLEGKSVDPSVMIGRVSKGTKVSSVV